LLSLQNIVPSLPLIISILLTLVIFFLVLKGIKKNIITNPVIAFIMLGVLLAGFIFTFLKQDLFILSVTNMISLLLALKQIKLQPAKEKELVIQETEPEPIIEQVETSEDDSILETSKKFMIQATEAFAEDSGLSRLLDFINTNIIEATKADGGAVLLIDDFEDIISVKSFTGDFPPPFQLPAEIPHKIIRVETNFRFSQFPLSETIFGYVARSGKPELIIDPLSDDRLYQNEPEEFLKLGSYIFVPLKIRDTVIGVISLARKFDSPKFTEEEFKIAKNLTDFACISIKTIYSFKDLVERSELTKETELACSIQKKMHPKLLPLIPSLSLGCYFNTAEGVCGDYYDVIPSRKDRISFILADVAGKGMNSLIVMVMIRAIMRLIVNTTQSAATILEWVNRGICAENSIDHFASIALMNYNLETKTIQLSSAGTTPVYKYSLGENSITCISVQSEPIGVEKTTKYLDQNISVAEGDIVFTFTDGLVETLNPSGKQYSVERLLKIIKENASLSGKDITSLVKKDIEQFAGSSYQHDDQTLLIMKIQ